MANSREQGGSLRGWNMGFTEDWLFLAGTTVVRWGIIFSVAWEVLQRPGCVLRIMGNEAMEKGFSRQKLEGRRSEERITQAEETGLVACVSAPGTLNECIMKA
jgi:hypothetical protein